MPFPMLDPASNSHNALASNLMDRRTSAADTDRKGRAASSSVPSIPTQKKPAKKKPAKKKPAKRSHARRALPKNSFLKRLDTLFWQRRLRYFYVRFLRMRSSPEAIARGVAAGVFAGSFPLLGLQIIIGVAISALVGGNKAIAAAATWISNPLTYVPIFWLNFHVGRWLLRLPSTTELSIDISNWQWNTFMTMGMQVFSSLMVGSLVMGCAVSVLGYFVGLAIARRLQYARARKRR